MATAEQQAFLRSLEEEKSEPARRSAATRGRFMRGGGGGSGLSVTIVRAAGQSSPVNAGPINFTVTFSKAATGFTNADISFAGSTVGGTLAAAITGTGPYNVAVTGMTGTGLVRVNIPAGSATDPSAASFPASNSVTVMFDTTAPSVTIDLAASQQDPTSASPINFTAVFSKSVTGFTASDISFTGSTVGGTLAAAVSGSGSIYNVAVTGMTTAGNVVASIPAAAATDLAGNASLASTSTDNTVGFNPATISHGEQLAITDVGPWTLQGVAKGAESLDTVAVPARGYWLMDTPSEWAPTGTYVLNNTPSNKGGIVPAGGLTIDGFVVPAGTVVCQFRNLSGTDFSAQGQAGNYLFRGCRFRQNGIGDPSQFNDFTATYTNALHYCDMGGLSSANADADAPFWKSIGGQNHRVLRCYMTYQKVALQPNTPNFVIAENYIDKITFFWGSAGPPAGGGPNHTAAIGCEGGGSGFRFYRNRIVIPSPDDAGRVIENGATVAMEGTNGQTYTDCQVTDNYVAGANYSFLLFGERAGQTNLVFTGNKITTQFWTDSGISGPVQAGPFPVPWGINGNVKANNTWADDYGTGGTGSGTPLSSRQFPTGNGPRKGTTFI